MAYSLISTAFVHTAATESSAVALQLYSSPSTPLKTDFTPTQGHMHQSDDYQTALSKPQPIAYNHSSSSAFPNRNTA